MIQINPIIVSNPTTMKEAIEKIAREAQAMQSVAGQEDKIYVDTIPTVDNTREGQLVFFFDGTDYRIYTKVNGTIRFFALT